jgi:hypothetical protein
MNIEFTDAQLDYVARVLSQRPWAEVNDLLVSIRQQVDMQQHGPWEHPIQQRPSTVGVQQANGLDQQAI